MNAFGGISPCGTDDSLREGMPAAWMIRMIRMAPAALDDSLCEGWLTSSGMIWMIRMIPSGRMTDFVRDDLDESLRDG
jgi:hypothetical protein